MADAPEALRPLSVVDTLGDLLNHPAFKGFASRLLPWDGRTQDARMPLSAIGQLAPYHTHVDPASSIAALNRLIADAGRGQQIAYEIYTDAEKQADASKANAGLFFHRGEPGPPFAVVAPGGGFAYVGAVHEGFPYAAAIASAGFNAFVLKYRVGLGERIATEDLAAALGFIFRNAATLGVGLHSHSLWGSPAGARMAASIGSHGAARFGGEPWPKPAAVIMAYTAHADIATDEPPAFVIVGERDAISPPSAMRRRVEALRARGVPVEYHEIPGLGHGFGPGIGTRAEGWLDDAIRFWQKHQAR